MKLRPPTIPAAPRSIQKGVPLKLLLNEPAIQCLAENIRYVHPDFDVAKFSAHAVTGLDPLTLMLRGQHIAAALQQFLPKTYAQAIQILIAALTPKRMQADTFGLAEMFYLPYSFFIADYGQDPAYNDGNDPFDLSMRAMYELTMRFTSEFAIRTFIIQQPDRTLAQMKAWLTDPNPHVRRLCSEGSRPKLPWGKSIPSLIADPKPTLPILQTLKNDTSLYVRRSVANHLGDIAKNHPELVFEICEQWLQSGASKDLKWLIRHAVRHPAKQKNPTALRIRTAAK